MCIDRKDNDKDYSPENCQWVDRKIQNRNSRNCHYLKYQGEIKTLTEWSEIYNIPMKTLQQRITKLNWSVEIALTTPVQQHRR